MRLKAVTALVAVVLLTAKLHSGAVESAQADAHYNLALQLYQSQRYPEAEADLAKALSLVPKHPQANLLLGVLACRQGRFAEALDPLRLAAEGLKDPTEALGNLGVALLKLDRASDAAKALETARKGAPGRPDLALNLGLAELKLKRYAKAEACFAEAAGAAPKDEGAWLGWAEAADAAGDTLAALEARGRAVGLKSEDRALRLEWAQGLLAAGRLSETASALAPLEGSSDANAEFLLGIVAYREGEFQGSRERFEAALAARPDFPEARFNLAITYYDLGQFEEALRQFQDVLDRHPDDEEARHNLEITRKAAVAARLKGGSEAFLRTDYPSALEQWKAALALEPGDASLKDLIDTAQTQLKLQAAQLSAAAAKEWESGSRESAIAGWTKALACDPTDAGARAGLAGAKAEIAKNARVQREAAETALEDGRWAAARAAAKEALRWDAVTGRECQAKVEAAARKEASRWASEAESARLKGDWGRRVTALERAGEAEPGEAALVLDLNRAKVALRMAVDAALAQAQAAEKDGHWDEALKSYRRVLEWESSNAPAKEGSARAQARSKSQASGPNPAELEDLYYQGVYAYAAGDLDKAEGLWKRVLAADPKHQLAKEALERSRRNRAARGENH